MATKKKGTKKKASPPKEKFLVIREDCGNLVGFFDTMEKVKAAIEDDARDEGQYYVLKTSTALSIWVNTDRPTLDPEETISLDEVNW